MGKIVYKLWGKINNLRTRSDAHSHMKNIRAFEPVFIL